MTQARGALPWLLPKPHMSAGPAAALLLHQKILQGRDKHMRRCIRRRNKGMPERPGPRLRLLLCPAAQLLGSIRMAMMVHRGLGR